MEYWHGLPKKEERRENKTQTKQIIDKRKSEWPPGPESRYVLAVLFERK
jgi:hypothetical protein